MSSEGIPVRLLGVVTDIQRLPSRAPLDTEYLLVDYGRGSVAFHPKQCRLLKKKERKRVWMDPASYKSFYNGLDSWQVWNRNTKQEKDWIEFIEVKKK